MTFRMARGVQGQDIRSAFSPFASVGAPKPEARSPKIAVDELRLLRADLDMVAPPEAAELRRNGLDFTGPLTTGDHLRLPQMTFMDGRELRGAVRKVLRADTTEAVGSPEAAVKEAKMLRMLKALDGAQRFIQSRMDHAG